MEIRNLIGHQHSMLLHLINTVVNIIHNLCHQGLKSLFMTQILTKVYFNLQDCEVTHK